MEPVMLPAPANERVPRPDYPYRYYIPLQIRFSDIDVFNHVNNNAIFAMFDTGKIGYYRAVNLGQLDMHNIGAVVGTVTCSFFHPITLTDEVEVFTATEHIGTRSFVLEQRIVSRRSSLVHAVCRSIMVGFNQTKGCVDDLPDEWVRRLEDFEQRPLR